MFKIHEIREIIKLVDQSNITEFKIEEEGMKISIKKGTESAAAAAPAPAAPQVPQVQAAAPAPELVTAPVAAPAPQPVPSPVVPSANVEDVNLHKITSPMVGTFYKSGEPGAPAFVQAGDKVNDSTIVCIVEAMKLFNEIEAEVSGEIVKVLVEDGQLVEYGQPLFLVKPE
jgi:acetyl-CoA carboxylase biotin carboxyl carrier protein